MGQNFKKKKTQKGTEVRNRYLPEYLSEIQFGKFHHSMYMNLAQFLQIEHEHETVYTESCSCSIFRS